jgi:alkanesulfonate monooxygenase SsuD/methylene tetrahydromethanopterin reductase-like flavin-dependent oxidoreductase (luciferase family)
LKFGVEGFEMKYWVLLSQFELLKNYVPLAQLAEECGYAGVLIPDHVVFPVSYETTHPIKHPTTPEDMFSRERKRSQGGIVRA